MKPNMKRLFSDLFTGKKLIMSITSLLIVLGVISFAAYELTKTKVTLVAHGEEVEIKSHAKTVEELLMDRDIIVGNYDYVEPSLETAVKNNLRIEWKQAQQVYFTNNGETTDTWTTADTVEELIEELNIEVGEYDEIKPALTTQVTNEMNITYNRAFQVTLQTDGEEKEVWTTSTTVADLLDSEEITLGELDRVEPAKEEAITDQSIVNIIRVEKVTDVVEESVDFATVTRKDNSLAQGKESVIEPGTKGRVAKHYEVIYENGKEVARELVKTETMEASKDRVVAVGTRVQQSVSRSASPPPSGGKVLTMTATAYTANCSGCSGITATGINLNNNRNAKVVAVDPNVIPLGTRVHVEGYGNAIAGDTGGAIKGNKIDVHVPTKSDASSWGRKSVKVTILD
ncbi:ubiquitin-like domain-containing protein [Anaerobacillus sp. MEB173]|uniref:ubiquitin-like domain-containing protein n=1 Tax=Anaerobacillus sp. MEB173 TaxID=3383345 RepID=UPI003F9350B9